MTLLTCGMYDVGLLVRGMYPMSFFPSKTLKINGSTMYQKNPRTSSPLLCDVACQNQVFVTELSGRVMILLRKNVT